MKKSLLFLVAFALMMASCSNLVKEPESSKPQFDELIIEDVLATSMTWRSQYILKSHGDHQPAEYGFMYSTKPDVPVDEAIKDGTEYKSGYYNFSGNVEDLKPNTTYYGCLYCYTKDNKKYYQGEIQPFTTHAQGDFSQVKVKSPLNDDVELGFLGCYRVSSNKVVAEVTIKNLRIEQIEYFGIYFPGSGRTVDGKSYTTHFEDELYTDYLESMVSYEINGNKYSGSTMCNAKGIPVNATRKLKISINGVPASVKKLDLYIMSYFYNYNDCPPLYMSFENVPIY